MTIGTPDHWHVPIAIAALKAGCDVYCEKPLTLTIEEGFRIRDAVKETGKVFQVGTQQRSEHDLLFLKAIAHRQKRPARQEGERSPGDWRRDGRRTVSTRQPPEGLDWNMWVGPAQTADYSPERRKEFRWFYDYSGGKMTDWGAHHIDIAQWCSATITHGPDESQRHRQIHADRAGPFRLERLPRRQSQLAQRLPHAERIRHQLGIRGRVDINVCDEYRQRGRQTKFRNGILFDGDEGRIFVNRDGLTGKPIEEMTDPDREMKLRTKWCASSTAARSRAITWATSSIASTARGSRSRTSSRITAR